MTNNTFSRTIARIALPVISAGLIGGAALGMAGMANASTSVAPTGPGHFYAPTVTAHPAPGPIPGTHHHDRIARLMVLEPSYHP